MIKKEPLESGLSRDKIRPMILYTLICIFIILCSVLLLLMIINIYRSVEHPEIATLTHLRHKQYFIEKLQNKTDNKPGKRYATTTTTTTTETSAVSTATTTVEPDTVKERSGASNEIANKTIYETLNNDQTMKAHEESKTENNSENNSENESKDESLESSQGARINSYRDQNVDDYIQSVLSTTFNYTKGVVDSSLARS